MSSTQIDYRSTAPKMYPHPMMARTASPVAAPESRRSVTLRQLAGLAILGALIGLWISPGRAFADQIEPADHNVKTVRVTYAEPINRVALYMELNNGATYKLRPCRMEDGSGQRGGCYWDAGNRGNGIGDSFAVLPSGRFVYSARIGSAR